MEFLHAVGGSPTEQFKPDMLLDLMCFLRTRKSGDELASVAGRLNIGTRKVYNQNKHISVVKLPLVFTSLGNILASKFEEARSCPR